MATLTAKQLLEAAGAPQELIDKCDKEGDEGLTLKDFNDFHKLEYVRIKHLEERTDLTDPITNKKIGEILGGMQTSIKNTLAPFGEKLGVEVTEGSFKDGEGNIIKIVDALPIIMEQFTDGIKGLEDKAGQGNEEKYTLLETKYNTETTGYKKKLDELTETNSNNKSLLEEKENEYKSNLETTYNKQAYQTIKGKANWSDNATDIHKEWVDSQINDPEKFKLVYDWETNKTNIRKPDGTPVYNAGNTDELDLQGVFDDLLSTNKLVSVNGGGNAGAGDGGNGNGEAAATREKNLEKLPPFILRRKKKLGTA